MHNTRSRFGAHIRSLRKRRKWSLETLGERAGLSPNYCGGIERGERNLTIDNIEKLAGAFGLPVSELFSFETEGVDVKKKAVREIVQRLRKHDPDTLGFILRSIEYFDEWLTTSKV